MIEQITSTSEGCNYGCPFCFNGKNSFNEFELPEIKCNGFDPEIEKRVIRTIKIPKNLLR